MKTSKIFLVLFLTILLSFGFSVASFATIVNSPHNLAGRPGVVTQNGEVCIYCHSPHVEDITVIADYNPLWSGGVQTSTTFTPYTSATMDADMTGDPLVGPTRLCISCHDGTIAIDSALAASPGTRMIVPPRNIGGIIGGGPNQRPGDSLNRDHPVGFDYIAAAAADAEIQPATAAFGNGTISDYLFSSGTEEIMTCATCHDVHEWGPGHMFLLVDNAGSALCLSCHDK